MSTSLPPLPPAILTAALEKRLVIFLGAGISCAAGLPSWRTVKDELIRDMRIRPDDPSDIKEQLKKMPFYECFGAIYEIDRSVYERKLKEALACGPKVNKALFKDLLELLKRLNPVSFVTTNVDDLLLDPGLFEAVQHRSLLECAPQEIGKGNLFFIHGNRETSIFTDFQKTNLYGDHFGCFMHNLFGSYVVLFIGFSFEDRGVIDFARINDRFRNRNNKYIGHYALLPENSSAIAYDLRRTFGIDPLFYSDYTAFQETLRLWGSPKISLNVDINQASTTAATI